MSINAAMTPEQARGLRTARFCSAVRALHPALPAAQIYLRYMNYVWNKFRKRREVIFMCYRNAEFSHLSFLGCYYASALEDFAT
jgi:hypothetical protein